MTTYCKNMGEVTISREGALKLIEKGICRKSDFKGLDNPYFKMVGHKQYKCVRCSHPITSFMGIMQHIKKHKNQEKRLEDNKRLTETTTNNNLQCPKCNSHNISVELVRDTEEIGICKDCSFEETIEEFYINGVLPNDK